MVVDEALADRLVDKIVLMPDGCWQWSGSLVQKGYGQIKLRGKGLRAHRVVYEWLVGQIPEGLFLHHECRNRGCVNPAHLRPITNRENILAGNNRAAENARKTHCKNGHPFDFIHPVRNKRGCSICHRAYQELRRQRRAERRNVKA